MKKLQINIRSKITILLLTTLFIAFSFLIIVGYKKGYNLLEETIGQNNIEKSFLVSLWFSRIITEEVSNVDFYIDNEKTREGIQQHYEAVKDIAMDTLVGTYLDIDSSWLNLKENDPLSRKYLNNPLSEYLKEIVLKDWGLREIIISDVYGGLIAASDKTSDYYQADESWWQIGYNGGSGERFIGDAEFDESTQALVITYTFPLKDKLDGKILAIGKVGLDIQRVFEPLEKMQYFKSEHNALIDQDGTIIYRKDTIPLSQKIQNMAILNALRGNSMGWLDTHVFSEDQKELISFVRLINPLLKVKEIRWFVVSSVEDQVAFAPLRKLIK